MSIDPLHRSATPLSGRSTPVHRIRGQAEDDHSPKDKVFRRYATGVKQALATFESAQQDWADYISFLGRVQKALQARPAGTTVVPFADIIATRLAQSLNPNLPSGVHQKALEVYLSVLPFYESKALAQHLHIFLPGLSPVLTFASLSVRPYFLAIFDQHILPLGPLALRPALKALILSLLPGLEDETSEDFDRVVETIDKLRHGQQQEQTGDQDGALSFFWQCFFLATVTSPSRRQGALAYLIRRLPSFSTAPPATKNLGNGGTDERLALDGEAIAALSPEPGLLVRCFAAGLTDQQLLVQRGFLDLLISHLPLHSPVLMSKVADSDVQRLMSAVITVVLRRDMSLNRRLWQWLLGPESKDEEEEAFKNGALDQSAYQTAYFSRFGLRHLTDSILAMIETQSMDPIQRAKPFRICLSLMDRWEVGGLLIPAIFLPAMTRVCEYSSTAKQQDADEVVKSAGIFFDGIESSVIWSQFLKLIIDTDWKSSTNIQSQSNATRLCDFIVRRFNLREEEMTELHIPMILVAMALVLRPVDHSRIGTNEELEYMSNLLIIFEVIERMSALITVKTHNNSAHLSDSVTTNMLDDVVRYYKLEEQGVENNEPPAWHTHLPDLLASRFIELTLLHAEKFPSAAYISSLSRATCIILQKMGIPSSSSMSQMFTNAALQIAKGSMPSSIVPLPAILAIVQVMITFQSYTTQTPAFSPGQIAKLQHVLVKALWQHLDPYEPKYHVEAVRCLFALDSLITDSSQVESAITTELLNALRGPSPRCASDMVATDAIRRINVIWVHAFQDKAVINEKPIKPTLQRNMSVVSMSGSFNTGGMPSMLSQPLLTILEESEQSSKGVGTYIQTWLHNLPNLGRVFQLLLHRIAQKRCLSPSPPSTKFDNHLVLSQNDLPHCLHMVKHVLNLLNQASDHMWSTMTTELVQSSASFVNSSTDATPTIEVAVVHMCLRLMSLTVANQEAMIDELHQTALLILKHILQGPYATLIDEINLEEVLLKRLHENIDSAHPSQQLLLLETITAAFRLRLSSMNRSRAEKLPTNPSASTLSLQTAHEGMSIQLTPPPLLIECLKKGFTSSSSQVTIDGWVEFLADVMPLFATQIFQNLIPLVDCLCKQIQLTYNTLRLRFEQGVDQQNTPSAPETTLISLMNGLESLLAKAHERLLTEEEQTNAAKSPEQPQGFLGSMVQGVFTAEAPAKGRAATANSRLTVILCFQDAVRTCFDVWRWGQDPSIVQDSSSHASYNYTSLRMRNRSRRLLEHLFVAEGLECLETLIVLWEKAASLTQPETSPVVSLLNVLTGASPKHTFPAVFNALYSRTNPAALDPSRLSSLTSDLSDEVLIKFLITYTRSVDDDSIDEIWSDCMAFLKEVLSNPLPHRQILPLLLLFLAEIAGKVESTGFGEQKKMRKDLADHFLRLLTATFTTRSQGLLTDSTTSTTSSDEKQRLLSLMPSQPVDVLSILAEIVPDLPYILSENDRVTTAAQSISLNVIAPAIKSKSFPIGTNPGVFQILLRLSKLPQSAKFWRKDANDALNDPRLFTLKPELIMRYWMPIVRQLGVHEKDRFTELLTRFTPPSTAGIVFGVGATSARQDADRKTSLNLRRITLSIISSPTDTYVSQLGALVEKIDEIFTATSISSPSTSTWADAFLLLRAIVLKTSSVLIAPMWPLINERLQSALLSIVADESDQEAKYNNASLISACQLLDTLIGIGAEDFQVYEWLYITDTIDAVYRPADIDSAALADEIAEVLGSTSHEDGFEHDAGEDTALHNTISGRSSSMPLRRPLFDSIIEKLSAEYDMTDLKSMSKAELAQRVLRPYFGQLSLLSFEHVYAGATVLMDVCIEGVVRDLGEGIEGGA